MDRDYSKYLKPGERLDDLERDGLMLIQNPERFCFGMDAVLLSGFATGLDGKVVIDLCSGNGIIPVLLSAKSKASSLTGLEILPENVEMARRSIELNGLLPRVNMVQGDVKESVDIFGHDVADVITCNPPYMAAGHGLTNPNDAKMIARHEILCSLEDVIKASSRLLKTGGKLFMVHRPTRLVDIISELTKYNLEPKRIQFVHPYADKKPNMVLIEAAKGGGRQLTIEPPLIVYNENGERTEAVDKIYNY